MYKEYHQVEIQELFGQYSPKIPITKIIRRLIASIPDKYLEGLEKVVLTDSISIKEELPGEHTKFQDRDIPLWECHALYYPLHEGRPAWILLIVDNILDSWPIRLFKLRVPPIRDLFLCTPFYHEVGHHIHAEIKPEDGDKEQIAEKWGMRLSRRYLMRRYWYFFPLVVLLLIVKKFLKTDDFVEKTLGT